MFKTKDILKSLEKEKRTLKSKITPDYIAEELSKVISSNGIINFKKEDIKEFFSNYQTIEYSIPINTDINSKISYSDILEAKNLKSAKN